MFQNDFYAINPGEQNYIVAPTLRTVSLVTKTALAKGDGINLDQDSLLEKELVMGFALPPVDYASTRIGRAGKQLVDLAALEQMDLTLLEGDEQFLKEVNLSMFVPERGNPRWWLFPRPRMITPSSCKVTNRSATAVPAEREIDIVFAIVSNKSNPELYRRLTQ